MAPAPVNGEQISPGKGRRTGGPAHLMRNIVELEVEEHLEPTLFERADDLRPLGVKERHADLEPPGVAGQGVGELEGAIAVAIDGDDNAVARICL